MALLVNSVSAEEEASDKILYILVGPGGIPVSRLIYSVYAHHTQTTLLTTPPPKLQ